MARTGLTLFFCFAAQGKYYLTLSRSLGAGVALMGQHLPEVVHIGSLLTRLNLGSFISFSFQHTAVRRVWITSSKIALFRFLRKNLVCISSTVSLLFIPICPIRAPQQAFPNLQISKIQVRSSLLFSCSLKAPTM